MPQLRPIKGLERCVCHFAIVRWGDGALLGGGRGAPLPSSTELAWAGLCRGETKSWKGSNLRGDVGRQGCALEVMLGATVQGTLQGRGATWPCTTGGWGLTSSDVCSRRKHGPGPGQILWAEALAPLGSPACSGTKRGLMGSRVCVGV